MGPSATQLIIVGHEPFASALASVGRHAFPELAHRVSSVDVGAYEPGDQSEARLRHLLGAHASALVLVDVFGATPGNVASRLVDGSRSRVIFGANVAMLWRALGYLDRPLAEVAELATAGATQGILHLSGGTRPQNQSTHGPSHDPKHAHDQQ
jgi:PTS system ascorbate-specific IIA component